MKYKRWLFGLWVAEPTPPEIPDEREAVAWVIISVALPLIVGAIVLLSTFGR